ncbi:MAG: hypothetical protein ACTSQ4_12290 [Candidatus Heimdallarchaeaceae archaeon]
MALMVKVEFRCPSCSSIGKLDVDEDLLKQTKRGVLAVTIPHGKLCSHSFVAYVDKNLAIRDCFSADFLLEIPVLIEEDTEEEVVPEKKIQEIEIIKLNLPTSVIVYITRAMFLKKKILLVSDKKHLYDYYRKFFDYVVQNSFDIDLSFTTKILYKLNRKDFREFVVIGEDKEIIQDNDKIFNVKKLKIEKNIIHEFFKNIDILQSLIILKNEIHKIYKISENISEIAKEYHLSEIINHDDIHESLEHISATKVQSDFLNLLIDIIENYFKVHVPMSLKLILKKWKKKKK